MNPPPAHELSAMSPPRRRLLIALLALAAVALVICLAPYSAPIRAASLAQHRQAIEFTDRNGLPLGTLLTRDQEHTAAVPLFDVAPVFLQAIIAAEDSRYYQHGAVDGRAIARALWQAGRARHVVSGASTITMQLARMIHPVPATIPGKLLQVWIALRITAGMNKNEALEAYVNRIPMGGNVYGVEAASRTFLGLPASQLDLAQASLLAAIPNDPNGLFPYDHWPALKRRQVYVLDRMRADGAVSLAQAERAAGEQVMLQPRGEGIVAAPHLLFWLAGQVPDHTSHVKTTIDRDVQQFVETQVSQVLRGLSSRNVHHAAVLVVDNHNGQVLAYVGSPNYFSEAQLGRNDGVQALRQPGSALKPFLYELALETRSIHPNTILADIPTSYSIPGAMLYSPTDYNRTFQGPVRVRIALADSLNVPAVRVLASVGVPQFLDRLHALGFSHLTRSADYYGLGLTLGGGEVSLWELTRAYVTLARGGNATDLTATFGNAAQSASTAGERRIGDVTSWSLVADILSDTHARAKAFGVGSVLDLPFSAAVKTGTSSDFRDTWTVGFSRDYTVGVWVGNFNGEPMRTVSGVTGAAPLWNRVLSHLHEEREPQPFEPPAGLKLEPICASTGLRAASDCQAVVFEYLYPQDLAAYWQPAVNRGLTREYDEWLSHQSDLALPARFKILFPRDGDVFAVYPQHNGFAPEAQALKFEAAAPSGQAVTWWLNGQRMSAQTSRSAFWRLQPGHWTLRAVSRARSDEVSFAVIEGHERILRRGFSLVSAAER